MKTRKPLKPVQPVWKLKDITFARIGGLTFDTIVAGSGPAGLSAAETLAARGRSVVVVEQNHEIGSPIRTSGGSFVADLEALEIGRAHV